MIQKFLTPVTQSYCNINVHKGNTNYNSTLCIIVSCVLGRVPSEVFAHEVGGERGNSVNRSSKDWQMPEIRQNMGERLTLFDPIARCSREVDLAREERAKLWQSAHCEGVRV